MIISPSMSLVAIGVASGICFLLVNGFRSRKDSKTRTKGILVDDGRCACCLAPLLVGRGVRCSDCGARSCRKSCSRWNTSENAWYCLFCHQQRSCMKRNEKWFENFGGTVDEDGELHRSFGTVKSRARAAEHADSDGEQAQEDREEMRTLHAVRDFIEKIVESFVDNVDDTPIDRLYADSRYDKFMEEHRPSLTAVLTRVTTCLQASLTNKPSTDPPTMAHAALKEIVERAVEEARRLPSLETSADAGHSQEERAAANRSYEDLLATAILNKVIEKFQRERVDGNSNVLHDIDALKTKRIPAENEYSLEQDIRSYEDIKSAYRLECNGDCNIPIRQNGDHQEPVSFTMEERTEEVTTIASDDELQDNDPLEFKSPRRIPFPEFGMDIVDPPREFSSPTSSSDSSEPNRDEYSQVKTRHRGICHMMDLVSPVESWEDNWLFQKRKTSRSQPNAVAMLVPNSNAYYKALIGDKDAEDTSDLSECSSTKSDEEIEKELMEAINNVVPRTPTISECDIEDSQEVLYDEVQVQKNEVDEDVDEPNKKSNERFLKVPEVKADEVEQDKEARSESPLELITRAKEENESKENDKDAIEREENIIATIVKNSAENIKTQSKKLREKSDGGNVIDEHEEQRESEYTEHYDTAIQRHLDSLTKVEISEENETFDQTRKITDEDLEKSENNLIDEEKSQCPKTKIQASYKVFENQRGTRSECDQLSAPPRPGTIAEREHKKWENAPPLENNPYSEENIRKRSWEKRYSRKPADVSGVHYELTKHDNVNLEALLVPDKPDIKRFGRDYYINQSKVASGERTERSRSAMSSSSRPSSSLSQRSSSTGEEQRERQDESTYWEINGISVLQEDKEPRTTLCWKNNVEVISPETNNHAVNSCALASISHQRTTNEEVFDEMWKSQQTDYILENQRKNSKNEINAKLNNQEHSVEVERQDEGRKIRRIDLKAYGFENEFLDQRTTKQQRVVNKLDLRSFGYQDGLRRVRSNNRLDQVPNDEKSNLMRCIIDRENRCRYKQYLLDASMSLGCKDFIKSSRDLNKLHEVEQIGSLMSARSMPNVADDTYYYANPIHVNDENEDEAATRNLLDRVINKSEEEMTDERDAIENEDSSNESDENSSDVERRFEDIYIRSRNQLRGTMEKLPMPSVKRLAEVFVRRQTSEVESVPMKVNKTLITKIDDIKDRSSTPEVQIVETPRQMHSLTARSLSREFREGLRQMPGKVTSLPVSRSLIEERPVNRSEIVRSKWIGSDIAVISPGKLKSNIIFWEQMQKKS